MQNSGDLRELINKSLKKTERFIANDKESVAEASREAQAFFKDILKKFAGQADEPRDLIIRRPGYFYLFNYNPDDKKDTYDLFPLVFILSVGSEGIFGVNWHYMNPIYRASILRALLEAWPNHFLKDEAFKMSDFETAGRLYTGVRGLNWQKAYRKYKWKNFKMKRAVRIENMEMFKAINYVPGIFRV